jgi:DNA polymerase III sliding clamp (beta) subunit (PCNA family)
MTTLTIPAQHFADGVNSVLACASTDRTVPALFVIRVDWDAEAVRFIATDRYVLGEQTIPRPEPVGDDEGAISVPVPAIKPALALIKAGALAEVTIECNADAWGKGSVGGVAFDGVAEFPKYRALFPHDSAVTAIERNAFDPAKLIQLAGPKMKGSYCSLVLEYTGEAKIIRVQRQGGLTLNEGFRGLLMPIRLGSRTAQ